MGVGSRQVFVETIPDGFQVSSDDKAFVREFVCRRHTWFRYAIYLDHAQILKHLGTVLYARIIVPHIHQIPGMDLLAVIDDGDYTCHVSLRQYPVIFGGHTWLDVCSIVINFLVFSHMFSFSNTIH